MRSGALAARVTGEVERMRGSARVSSRSSCFNDSLERERIKVAAGDRDAKS